MAINTIIVDDERPARDELAFLLKSFPEINIVAQGKNGLEAVALIKEHDPDLVFLDVEMPGLDGFGVIKKLVERKLRLPQIVFATAYDHYAVQAFEVSAVDYVLKPFDKARVAKALERAKKMIDAHTSPVQRLETLVSQLGADAPRRRQAHPVKLLVKSQSRMILIDADDMIYASIQDGAITIFSRDTEGVSNYRTVDELMETLDPAVFWRPHRSYLININHIKRSRAVVQIELHVEDERQEGERNSRLPRADQAAARIVEAVVHATGLSFRGRSVAEESLFV